ncbi:MAG: hypothetical protein MUC49_08380 [Raineya sp.]|jgi:hypothetical protein|nr:hypothetical protein [Raineya sp.]
MKYLIGILIFISSLEVFSQQKMDVIGVYHESGSTGGGNVGGANYYILENHHFVIIAYATIIYGKWEINEKNVLILSPTKPPTFKIYGRYNPTIKSGAKIMFQNFESRSFIQINEETVFTPVFNENANCLSYPNVASFSQKTESISLATIKEIYKFQVKNNANDFIAIYHHSRDIYKPFTFQITPQGLIDNQGKVMKKKSLKMIDEEEKSYIVEIQKSIDANRNYLYVNHLYNNFDKYDTEVEEQYTFDKNKNAYCHKFAYKPNEENEKLQDAYNRDAFLYKYLEIVVDEKVKKEFEIASKPLFRATCE